MNIVGKRSKYYDVYIFLWNINREEAVAYLQDFEEYEELHSPSHYRALVYAKNKISMYPGRCVCMYRNFCGSFDQPVDYDQVKFNFKIDYMNLTETDHIIQRILKYFPKMSCDQCRWQFY